MNKIQGKVCLKYGTLNPQTQVSCINCGTLLPDNKKSNDFNNSDRTGNHKLSAITLGIVGTVMVILVCYGLITNGNLKGLYQSLTKLELIYYNKQHKIMKTQYVGFRSYPYSKKNKTPSTLQRILVYPNQNELKNVSLKSFDEEYKEYPQRRGEVVNEPQHGKIKVTHEWLRGRVLFENRKYYIDYGELKNGLGKCTVSNNPQIKFFSVRFVAY